MKGITYKDRVKLFVMAGNGGDGCRSFRREKYVPRGGPNGGDGGDGGSVILEVQENTSSLLDLYYRPHQRAKHGGAGAPKDCHGRNGPDLVVPVPGGTVVYDEKTGSRLGELVSTGERLVVAKGGKGGLGNSRFATSTNQAPQECTPGEPGEECTLILELKTVADIGLVGYPNAGKSTLISRITHAHPKVAAYPFTTLNPVVGTLQYDDYTRLRVTDIPGLIDGAHEGVGLGHDFLRHIERARFLVFVIDMAGVDGRNPADDYENLRRELKMHKADLDDRPFLVVANKMDLPEAEQHYPGFVERTGVSPLRISAEKEEGLEELVENLRRECAPQAP